MMLTFMACSFEAFSVMPGLVPGIHVVFSVKQERKKDVDGRDDFAKTRFALSPGHDAAEFLYSRHIELRLLAGAVAAQRAVLADRVGALEYPVLPCRQAGEDFRFHGLGSDEAQVRFHAGEAVGREAATLLEEHPDLVVPVDVVEREGDEAERLGLRGIERLAY